MKRLITLLTTVCFTMLSYAYDFHATSTTFVNSLRMYTCELYYAINPDGQTVTVVQGPETYKSLYVTIPEKVENDHKTYMVTAIGSSSFASSEVDTLIMGNTITEVQSEAFSGSLVKIVKFSTGLKYIRERAFYEASLLQSVHLYEGLESIGEGAFWTLYDGRHSLLEVILPNSLKSIGAGAFSNQRVLQKVNFSDAAVSIGNGAFAACEELAELNIPERTTFIGENAFYGCEAIKEVKIPDGFKEVAREAFSGCSSLTNVTLPEGLIKIGDGAFSFTALSEISFPSTLVEIGGEAFKECQFKSVVLPDHITTVGGSAFSENHKLLSFTFSKGMTRIESTVAACEQLVNVVIPEGITSIVYGSFDLCERLSTVKLPESLTSIEGYAFGRSGIQNINFPSGLNEIADYMFKECPQLTTIEIPSHIKTIGGSAFADCSNLSRVVLNDGLESIGGVAFRNTAIEEIIIPETVTNIGEYSFEDCSHLKKVKLPQSLETLNGYTFQDCSSLMEVNIPEKVTEIGWGVFYGCASLEAITIPSHVEGIGIDAFSNCGKLRKITLPSSVNWISWRSFENCASLTEFHINRAIPPTVAGNGNYNGDDFIAPNGVTILYVPRGSKAAYEEMGVYKQFSRIEEEDVDGTIFYRIRPNIVAGYGTVTVNGVDCYDDAEVARGEKAVISITPAEGWLFKSLTVNGNDVTVAIENGTYTIDKMEENVNLEVSFVEAPINLTIKMGNGGYMNAQVKRGEPFTCQIKAEEGWKVNSVLFNDNDVTSELADGIFVTPTLTSDAILSVSFENTTGIQTVPATDSQVRANVTADGLLTISGLTDGENISLVMADGKVVKRWISNGYTQSVELNTHGIYIVHTKYKTIKVNF